MWEEVKKSNLIDKDILMGNRLFSVETMEKMELVSFCGSRERHINRAVRVSHP